MSLTTWEQALKSLAWPLSHPSEGTYERQSDSGRGLRCKDNLFLPHCADFMLTPSGSHTRQVCSAHAGPSQEGSASMARQPVSASLCITLTQFGSNTRQICSAHAGSVSKEVPEAVRICHRTGINARHVCSVHAGPRLISQKGSVRPSQDLSQSCHAKTTGLCHTVLTSRSCSLAATQNRSVHAGPSQEGSARGSQDLPQGWNPGPHGHR